VQQTTENFLFHLMSEQRNGKKIKNLNFIPLVLNEHFAKLDFLDKSIKNKALDK